MPAFLRSFFASCLVVLVFANAAPAGAQDLEKARSLVQVIAEQGISDVVNAPIPHEQKIERFSDLFATYFDIPSIARFVLGRHWRSATPEEQERFVELFRQVNVYTWARRFKDYSGQELAVTNVQPDGDKGALVETRVEQVGGQQPLIVTWRLRERGDTFKVVDLIVEGVSMAITYRSEYGSVIAQHGDHVGRLNDLLAQQLERLRAEQPS